MDLFGINGYCLDSRFQLVLERGVFITTRQAGQYCISLYHMGDFFAEVWCSHKTDKIALVRGFNDNFSLEGYLQTIDVTALMA